MKSKSICYLLVGFTSLFFSSCSDKSGPSDGNGSSEKTDARRPRISKGEVYRAIDSKIVVKMISSSEVEISEKADHFVGQYSVEGVRLRATVEVLGTKEAVYFDIIPEGLRGEDGQILYRPDRYDVVMREVEAKRKQQALNEQLFQGVREGNLTNAIAALEGGAQVAATNDWKDTPLHIAAERGDFDIVKLLLEKGANPNARLVNPALNWRAKMTPLHLAARGGAGPGDRNSERGHVISVLLKAGADVNAEDEQGQTPLMLAFLGENQEALKLLAAAGADRTSVLAYARRRIRDGGPDRRAWIRTEDEEKLFQESLQETRVIQKVKSFDPPDIVPINRQFVLTDVGLKFVSNDGSE